MFYCSNNTGGKNQEVIVATEKNLWFGWPDGEAWVNREDAEKDLTPEERQIFEPLMLGWRLKTGNWSIISAGDGGELQAGYSSYVEAGCHSKIWIGDASIAKGSHDCTIHAGVGSMVQAGPRSIVYLSFLRDNREMKAYHVGFLVCDTIEEYRERQEKSPGVTVLAPGIYYKVSMNKVVEVNEEAWLRNRAYFVENNRDAVRYLDNRLPRTNYRIKGHQIVVLNREVI